MIIFLHSSFLQNAETFGSLLTPLLLIMSWFTKIISIHHLEHFFRSDVFDGILYSIMMWCCFRCICISMHLDDDWLELYYCHSILVLLFQSSSEGMEPSLSLAITCIDSKTFIQFAPINNTMRTSSLWTIFFSIGLRCSHSVIFSGVSITSLPAGRSFLAQSLDNLNQLPSPLIPFTRIPATVPVIFPHVKFSGLR